VRTTRLRITLLGVEPTVIRVIDVPAARTLPELPELLQAAERRAGLARPRADRSGRDRVILSALSCRGGCAYLAAASDAAGAFVVGVA
jgi:hypothetical protein